MDEDESSRPKKKSKPESIESLIERSQWDSVRYRITMIRSTISLAELLFRAGGSQSDIPVDIFRRLLRKLHGEYYLLPLESDSEYETDYEITNCPDTLFFGRIFKYQRRRYRYTFDELCSLRSTSTLECLLRTFQIRQTVIYGDDGTNQSISHMWSEFLQEATGNYDKLLAIDALEKLSSHPDVQCLWEKTVLLLKFNASWVPGIDCSIDDRYPLVHDILRLNLPNVILWFAHRLYPNHVKQIGQQRRHSFIDGKLPLHLAALLNNEPTEHNLRETYIGELHFLNDIRRVEMILDYYPEAANQKDSSGTLPLHHLLDLEHRTWTENDWAQRCTYKLVKAYPEALRVRSNKPDNNKLMPFMIAASIHERNAFRHVVKRKMVLRKVNMCYALLREEPTAVSSGIKESVYVAPLKKRIQTMEKEMKELREEIERLQMELSSQKKSWSSS